MSNTKSKIILTLFAVVAFLLFSLSIVQAATNYNTWDTKTTTTGAGYQSTAQTLGKQYTETEGSAFLKSLGIANGRLIPYCNPITQNYTPDAFIVLGINLAKIILGLSGAIALLMFVMAGFYLLISQGSSDKVTKGFDILKNSTIGLIIIMGSWMSVNILLNVLAGDDVFSNNSTYLNRQIASSCTDIKSFTNYVTGPTKENSIVGLTEKVQKETASQNDKTNIAINSDIKSAIGKDLTWDECKVYCSFKDRKTKKTISAPFVVRYGDVKNPKDSDIKDTATKNDCECMDRTQLSANSSLWPSATTCGTIYDYGTITLDGVACLDKNNKIIPGVFSQRTKLNENIDKLEKFSIVCFQPGKTDTDGKVITYGQTGSGNAYCEPKGYCCSGQMLIKDFKDQYVYNRCSTLFTINPKYYQDQGVEDDYSLPPLKFCTSNNCKDNCIEIVPGSGVRPEVFP